MSPRKMLLASAAAVFLAAPARACLSGWDCCKWDDPKHQTPKYVVGRILEPFDHTPAGLRQALPIINAIYPETTILPGKGDKIHIPCVGTIDVIVAAGEGGKAWWWGAQTDECGKCKPNRCEDVSKSAKCGGGGSGSGPGTQYAGGGGAGPGIGCGGVRVPNRLEVVQRTADENPEEWKAKLNPDEAACRADSRFLDMVVDNLRREDRRWGFNCKRGDCNNPSHDVVAYYFGSGEPYEGAPQVMLVDMITATCAPGARPGWLPLEFGEGAGWTSKGRFPGGPKQDIQVHCPKGASTAGQTSVAPLGGGGGGSAPSSSSAPNSAARSNEPHGIIGGRNDKGAPKVEGPATTEDPPPAPEAPAEPSDDPAQ